MMEEWRPVVGHEGAYEVSSLGRVRSLPRTCSAVRKLRDGKRKPWSRTVPGRMLATSKTGRYGYRTVRMGGKTRALHVIMLEAFVGPRPPGLCGMHKDECGWNNVIENLKWGTYIENNLQARAKQARKAA